jgi:hypothetical protein
MSRIINFPSKFQHIWFHCNDYLLFSRALKQRVFLLESCKKFILFHVKVKCCDTIIGKMLLSAAEQSVVCRPCAGTDCGGDGGGGTDCRCETCVCDRCICDGCGAVCTSGECTDCRCSTRCTVVEGSPPAAAAEAGDIKRLQCVSCRCEECHCATCPNCRPSVAGV